MKDGEQVTIAGLVTGVQHRVAKTSGNPYGIITVEDFVGEMTVMFMGKTYQEYQTQLVADTIVAVRGRVSMRDDGMNVHAQGLTVPKLSMGEDSRPLILNLLEQRATESLVGELDRMLRRHDGVSDVKLNLIGQDTVRHFELPHRVKLSAGLYGELKALLGPGCFE